MLLIKGSHRTHDCRVCFTRNYPCSSVQNQHTKTTLLAKGLFSGTESLLRLSGSSLFLFSPYIRIFSACNIITHFMFYKPHWSRIDINASWSAGPIFIFCDSKYWLGSCKNKLCLRTYSLATTKKITFRFKAVEMAHMRRSIEGAFSESVCCNPSLVSLSHQGINS